jgi:stage II sporulation protein AB (anti-sigma F factor)
MKHILNNLKFRLPALEDNVALCSMAVSNFVGLYNPSIEELGDIRCSVSEAFQNCVNHAYNDLPEGKDGFVYVSVRYYDLREVSIEISDNGCGFENANEVLNREPGPGNNGMGFILMRNFMDSVIIKSKPGKGTTILMRKALGK